MCRKIGLLASRFQNTSNFAATLFKEIEFSENGGLKLIQSTEETFLDWSNIQASGVINTLIEYYKKNKGNKLFVTELFTLHLLTAVDDPVKFESSQKSEICFSLRSSLNNNITVIEVSEFINQIVNDQLNHMYSKVAVRIVSVILKNLDDTKEILANLQYSLQKLIFLRQQPLFLKLTRNQTLCIVPDAVTFKVNDLALADEKITVLLNIYTVTHDKRKTRDFLKYLKKFIFSQIELNFDTTAGLINRLHIMSQYGL